MTWGQRSKSVCYMCSSADKIMLIRYLRPSERERKRCSSKVELMSKKWCSSSAWKETKSPIDRNLSSDKGVTITVFMYDIVDGSIIRWTFTDGCMYPTLIQPLFQRSLILPFFSLYPLSGVFCKGLAGTIRLGLSCGGFVFGAAD